MVVKPLVLGVVAGAWALVVPSPARAEEQEEAPFRYPVRDDSDTTFGMAEFGIGLLTLPTAEVCVERTAAGCSRGDRSLMLSAAPIFRRGAFAAGAGVMVGLTPTTDAPRNDPPGLKRDHSRTYFTVEATGRYYLELSETLDGWVGITSGLIVVNDTFTTETGQSDVALVGPPGVTILTEGYSIGAAGGLSFPLSDNWLIGGNLRLSNWFLPRQPATDPLGDEASLSGSVLTIDLALTVSFRSRIIL